MQATASTSVNNGTTGIPYKSTPIADGALECVSADPNFSNYSFEELRLVDYQKAGKAPGVPASGMGGGDLGAPTPATTTFGQPAQPTASAFGGGMMGGGTTPSAFGTGATGFGSASSTPFGQAKPLGGSGKYLLMNVYRNPVLSFEGRSLKRKNLESPNLFFHCFC